MVIDLFSNQYLGRNKNKFSKQIEVRKFKLVDDVEKVREFIKCSDEQKVEDYVSYLKELSEHPREYEFVGPIAGDNLADLEMLGIGAHAMDFTVCIDFSDALDYALKLKYGCTLESVRKIPEYHKVSNAILNNNFTEVEDISFGVLFDISDELNVEFANLLNQISDESMSIEEKKVFVVYQLYLDIVSTIASVKDYVAAYLCHSYEGQKFVYRSKTTSSIILTTNTRFDEDILLRHKDFGEYTVKARSYAKFEYAKERVFTYVAR